MSSRNPALCTSFANGSERDSSALFEEAFGYRVLRWTPACSNFHRVGAFAKQFGFDGIVGDDIFLVGTHHFPQILEFCPLRTSVMIPPVSVIKNLS